ncbi:hypothetical protein ERJ75_001643400 [Trypanosoma vivax]|nr:hypothetical protein ERJ75_001643400 [Trypanosoma vivax]
MWDLISNVGSAVRRKVVPSPAELREEQRQQKSEGRESVFTLDNHFTMLVGKISEMSATVKNVLADFSRSAEEVQRPTLLEQTAEERAALPAEALFRLLDEAIDFVTLRSEELQKEVQYLLGLKLEEQIARTSDFISGYRLWDRTIYQQINECQVIVNEYEKLHGGVDTKGVAALNNRLRVMQANIAEDMAAFAAVGTLLREEKYDHINKLKLRRCRKLVGRRDMKESLPVCNNATAEEYNKSVHDQNELHTLKDYKVHSDNKNSAYNLKQEQRNMKAEKAGHRAEEEAKRRAEEEARRRAEEEARRRAEEEAKRRAEEEARQRAEEEAKRRAEEEARQRAEEEARRRAEEEARRRAEEEARRRAEEEAKRRAEEEARRRAEEEARQRAEEEARQRAEEEARRRAEEEARQRAEEEARQRAEEEARQRAEEEARRRAEEEARRGGGVLRRKQGSVLRRKQGSVLRRKQAAC